MDYFELRLIATAIITFFVGAATMGIGEHNKYCERFAAFLMSSAALLVVLTALYWIWTT